jgi:hypothetical protein
VGILPFGLHAIIAKKRLNSILSSACWRARFNNKSGSQRRWITDDGGRGIPLHLYSLGSLLRLLFNLGMKMLMTEFRLLVEPDVVMKRVIRYDETGQKGICIQFKMIILRLGVN